MLLEVSSSKNAETIKEAWEKDTAAHRQALKRDEKGQGWMYLEQKIPRCSIVQKMWGSQTMGFPCSEPSAPRLLTRAALQPPMAVNWAR